MYNIRVYGLWLQQGSVLVSDEYERGVYMTKFPGGGHEFGESIPECLVREFHEELDLSVRVLRHFYTTDFFITSVFNPNQQLISHYYEVEPLEEPKLRISTQAFDFSDLKEGSQSFRWMPLDDLKPDDFTFPVDRHVAGLLKNTFK